MAKRKRKTKATAEEKRLNRYADIAGEVAAGHSEKLIDEVDAYRSFMMEWKKNYADEGDPRMALICAMTAGMISLLSLCVALQGDVTQSETAGHSPGPAS